MVHAATKNNEKNNTNKYAGLSAKDIIEDFRTCCISRELSIFSRREVLTGKAKFGIGGAGKELPQVALARAFQKGDFRSGYYRDQTFMLATGLMSVEDFFAQLYGDIYNDTFSAGRQMNNHFASPLIDEEGNWLPQQDQYNVSADIAPTAGQMARALGLALASKKYSSNTALADRSFSRQGQEVSVCTIGDASTSEGVFWETMNAATVQQIPLAVFVWDDGYGISVPKKYQTTKSSISEALKGMKGKAGEGLAIHQIKGWDYPALVEGIQKGMQKVRTAHQPALFHIDELTQPQGHSTSGSHERYKSNERLQWEKDQDGIQKMEKWMIDQGIATAEELTAIRKEAKATTKAGRDKAWKAFNLPAKKLAVELLAFYQQLPNATPAIAKLLEELKSPTHPQAHELLRNARKLSYLLRRQQHELLPQLQSWIQNLQTDYNQNYGRHLYSESADSALRVPPVATRFSESSEWKNGYQILNAFFDQAMSKYPELYAFGEDVGQIGGVNQSFVKLQEKYGIDRIFDTGIREWTIAGQAIGMAMRGLRPIAEIQYLDYLLYALEPLSDDLATLRWRSNGQQKAPAIIRTRGHRLEGVWHSGSPLGMMINSLRGIHICVPRNMVQATGMYNTLLQAGEPGIVIECLNGYRRKELMPDNVGQHSVALGVPEVLQEGTDLTLLSYGSCIRIAEEACELLVEDGISVELIDAQTLLPFDLESRVLASVKKTNRLLIVDEDVPGGAAAYLLQQVVEQQNAYRYLDSAPQTLTAKAHRPAYGSDGDYFSKPSAEDIYDKVYDMMSEAEPGRF